MKLRIIISVLALFFFLLTLTGGVFYYVSLYDQAAVLNNAAVPIFRTSGYILLSLFVLIGLAVAVMYRIAGNSIIYCKKAEKRIKKNKEELELKLREIVELRDLDKERLVELKLANKELYTLMEKAVSANRVKGEFLANISHEIRTSMNGIFGMAELLSDTKLTNQQKEYIDFMKLSGDNMLLVINDILDISIIEPGEPDIEHVECNLDRAMNKTL